MKTHSLLGLLLVAAATTGCGDNQQPEDAVALYQELQAENYAATWDRAPGWPGREESNAVHAPFVELFINDVMANALSAGEPLTAWPDGSLIVKDGYTDDGTLDVVVAMEKRDGAWFYAEWFELDTGEAKNSGRPSLCTDCHSAGDDEVRSFTFP